MLKTKLGTIKQVNPDADRIILMDATGVYGDTIYTESEVNEGEYVSTINVDGYGDPNSLREDVVNYVVGKHKKVDGDVDVTFEPYSIYDATEFRAIITEDGWYQFKMITIPIVALPEDIEEGKLGFCDGQIMENAGDEIFVEFTPEDLYDSEYATEAVEQLFLANSSIKMQEMNSLMNDYNRADSTANRPKITRIKIQYDTVRGMVAGSVYQYARGNKYNAQGNIEWLNKYMADLVYGV